MSVGEVNTLEFLNKVVNSPYPSIADQEQFEIRFLIDF